MSETTTPAVTSPAPATPAAAPVPSGSSSAAYQEAAIALLSQISEGDTEVLAEAPTAPEPVKATEPPKVPEPPKVEEPVKPSEDLKGFDALVREKAALRRREEALKAREAQLEPITKALESDDPLAYLQASGKFTYEQLARQLIEGKKPEAQPKRVDPVASEVQELKRLLMEERANAQRAQAMADVVQLVRGAPDKFKFVAGKKMERQVLKNLEDYVNETGALPAEDLATSIQLAAEAVELNLRKEAQEWAALLTPAHTPAKVSSGSIPESAVQRPQEKSAATSTSPTLTNSQAAVPAKPANPKTAEEYQALALALLNQADTH